MSAISVSLLVGLSPRTQSLALPNATAVDETVIGFSFHMVMGKNASPTSASLTSTLPALVHDDIDRTFAACVTVCLYQCSETINPDRLQLVGPVLVKMQLFGHCERNRVGRVLHPILLMGKHGPVEAERGEAEDNRSRQPKDQSNVSTVAAKYAAPQQWEIFVG